MPTVGGMILFGKERERHFPDAWIQAGRFAGTDKSRILDRAEFRAIPVRGVEEAIAFVQKHAWHGAEIGAVRRAERWSVPPAAVREAIINAVAHADYAHRGAPIRLSIFDDRLEVENPGLLPSGLTLDDLPRGVSKLRNRVIGRVFHALGLIEQWGSGIQRMSTACREAGLDAPVFEELATRFRVTITVAADRASRARRHRPDDCGDSYRPRRGAPPARLPRRSACRPAPRARGWPASSDAGSCARLAPGRRIPSGDTSWPSEDRHEPDPGTARPLDIDAALVAAGWIVQDRRHEPRRRPRRGRPRVPDGPGHGFADYLLFVNGKAVGVLEAKPAGYLRSTSSSRRTSTPRASPPGSPAREPPPLHLHEHRRRDPLHQRTRPRPKTRAISANLPEIHRPETLAEWITAETLDAWVKRLHAEGSGLYTAADDTRPSSFRGRITTMPPLEPAPSTRTRSKRSPTWSTRSSATARAP